MSRFYFDITDIDVYVDDVGLELTGLSAARLAAVRLAGEFLKDGPDRFWARGRWDCSVRDEAGATLFALHVSASEGAAADLSH